MRRDFPLTKQFKFEMVGWCMAKGVRINHNSANKNIIFSIYCWQVTQCLFGFLLIRSIDTYPRQFSHFHACYLLRS